MKRKSRRRKYSKHRSQVNLVKVLNEKSKLKNIFRPSLVISLVLIALLGLATFWRVEETEVELELKADEVDFRLTEDTPFGPTLLLSKIIMNGLEGIDTLGAIRLNTAKAPADKKGVIMEISALKENTFNGEIALGLGILRKNSRLMLRTGNGPGKYSIKSQGSIPQLSVGGQITLAVNHGKREAVDLSGQRPIELYAGDGPIETSLTFSSKVPYRLRAQIPIDSLTFGKIETIYTQNRKIKRDISAIRSGTIYLKELQNRKRELRPGDKLTFGNIQGLIRSLELSNGQIKLGFSGFVQDMKLEIGRSAENLMPRYLEIFYMKDWLVLLWTAVVYFCTIAISVYSWWQKAS